MTDEEQITLLKAENTLLRFALDRAKRSSVFLGLDHNFMEKGPPIVFETMVFGGPFNHTMWRYATWDEAVKGHEELVKMVVESGLGAEQDGKYVLVGELTPLAIPSTLQDSLTARLDSLSSTKEIAQLAAMIGREFGFELIQAVSHHEQRDAVGLCHNLIHHLGRQGIIVRHMQDDGLRLVAGQAVESKRCGMRVT